MKFNIGKYREKAYHTKQEIINNKKSIMLGGLCSLIIVALLTWRIIIPKVYYGSQAWAAFYRAGGQQMPQLQNECLQNSTSCNRSSIA